MERSLRQGQESSIAPRAGAGVLPLEVVDASKRYAGGRRRPARVALDGLSLSAAAGEWIALLGPNGSGKSSLVRMISGAAHPDSGQVRVFGHDPAGGERREALRRMSIVFQKPGLDPLLTVRENLRTAAALFGWSGRASEERIASVAGRLGLGDRLADRVAGLSGGLQRRADLARALLNGPELLILDEATAGLDHEGRGSFLGTIDEMRRATPGMCIIMTTHLMDEAERCARVVMMASGRIVADGSPAALRGGGRVLRVGPVADAQGTRGLLQRLGLEVRALAGAENGRLIARAEANDTMAQAAEMLVRWGDPFEIAPPTLGDAYLSLTGERLDAAVPQEPTRRRRGR